MPAAIEMAERIAENPPLGVQAIKKLVYIGMNEPFDEAIRQGWALYEQSLSTEDVEEGSKAFRERRKAVYRGR